MNLATKTGGILSRFLSTKKVATVTKARLSENFYAFVSTKREKELKEGEVAKEIKPEIKFRVSKDFTADNLVGMVGVLDIENPILFIYPEGCGLPEELFKKRKKDSVTAEVGATVFSYSPLVKVLKEKGLMPADYGLNADDANLPLGLTEITKKYLEGQDTSELPEGFRVFSIEKDSDEAEKVSDVVNETLSQGVALVSNDTLNDAQSFESFETDEEDETLTTDSEDEMSMFS